jgi:hypothetical protein
MINDELNDILREKKPKEDKTNTSEQCNKIHIYVGLTDSEREALNLLKEWRGISFKEVVKSAIDLIKLRCKSKIQPLEIHTYERANDKTRKMYVYVDLTPEIKVELEDIARYQGVSMSDLLREHIRFLIKKIHNLPL